MYNDKKKLEKIIDKTEWLSSSAQINRSLANASSINPPQKGSLKEEEKLDNYLNKHKNIKGLRKLSETIKEYEDCIDQDLNDSRLSDNYSVNPWCTELLKQQFILRNQCLKENLPESSIDIQSYKLK